MKKILVQAAALILAFFIWIPMVHLFFKEDISNYLSDDAISPKAKMLAGRQLKIWRDPELRKIELQKMQNRNPEWDFMSRTFFVLSLANMAIREPGFKDEACGIMDCIIDATLETEKRNGMYHFLLEYASRSGAWKIDPPRSIFIDGEIALMLGARRLVGEKPEYASLHRQRISSILERMGKSPVMCSESYPDECWIFCNTIALASIKMSDVLDKTDNSEFLARWVDTARKSLTDRKTGLLISTYTVDGSPLECGFGPEGTSIWLACHMLQIIDRDYAEDQYRRARKELSGNLLGFGYSREWPVSCRGSMDIDSGPVVPVLGASASASGLAFIAASAFKDKEYFSRLITSLNCGGFPLKKDGMLYYQAGNPVGDAVLLYSFVEGPLWEKISGKGTAHE
ncbi:MAG: hypothetical protein A2X45_13760 [Lentisphaerae bacterium GWF2_50_93]|nr:MAG: hypothetical protein A2X45_13760 [Lentisphaerae bacterium GWF2_50_93]